MQTRAQFFRLWGLSSLIWIGIIAVWATSEIQKVNATYERVLEAMVAYSGEFILPCTLARGTVEIDYARDSTELYCLYTEEKFVAHWPEFKDEDLGKMRLRFYAVRMGVDEEDLDTNPEDLIVGAVMLGIGIPLLSLIIGLLWRRVAARKQEAEANRIII